MPVCETWLPRRGRQTSPVAARYCPATGVAHLLEGVAAVAEVLRAPGDALQFEGIDLGSVLGAFEVAHLGGELVDGAVDASDLGVEGVDDAPEQALALVGDLEAVGAGALGHDAEGFADGGEGVVSVPDVPGVVLAGLGVAPKRAALSQTVAVGDCASVSKVSMFSMMFMTISCCVHRGVARRCDVSLAHARAGEAPGPGSSLGGWCGKSASGAEDRSAIFTVGDFHGPPLELPGQAGGSGATVGPRRGCCSEHVWDNETAQRPVFSLPPARTPWAVRPAPRCRVGQRPRCPLPALAATTTGGSRPST